MRFVESIILFGFLFLIKKSLVKLSTSCFTVVSFSIFWIVSRMDCQNHKKSPSSLFHAVYVGVVASSIETLVNHPLQIIKIRVQGNHLFTLNPVILYRGLTLSILSTAPVIVTQVVIHRFVQSKIQISTETPPKSYSLLSAFLAGYFSAYVASPMELLLAIMQEKKERPTYEICSEIYGYGLKRFFTGVTGTGLRIGIPACGFLEGVPYAQKQLKNVIENDWANMVVSGSTVGIMSAILSQPFDMIKTQQQFAVRQTLSIRKSCQKIYREHGFLGFFKGGTARIARVTSAVTILAAITQRL